METARTRETHALWPWATLIVLVTGVFLTWLLVKPGPPTLVRAADNLALLGAALLGAVLCVGRGRGWPGAARSDAPAPAALARRWAPLLLGLGLLSQGLGAGIWLVYAQILHQAVPFPSWADLGWLGGYPCWLLGILLLSGRPLSLAARARVVLDSLMFMTAVVTVSWYFLLGPLVIQGDEPTVDKIVNSAYPLGDLLLICCVLLLSARIKDVSLRPAVRLVTLALSIIVVTDSLYDYKTLHGLYAPGDLIDVGWALGWLLLGLGARSLRLVSATGTAPAAAAARPGPNDTAGRPSPPPPVWRALLPYALIPVVGVLVVVTRQVRSDDTLEPGVYLGAAVLVGLVVLHQILVIVENGHLYRRLSDAYRETVAAASRTQQLNNALRVSEQRYSSLFQHNHAVMLLIAPETGTIVDANPAACAFYGYSLDHLRAMTIAAINTLPRAQAVAHLEQARTGQRQHFSFRHRLASGDIRDVDVYSGPLTIGGQALLYSIVHDVTARVRAEQALRHQARHDALTGLPNRAFLHERVAAACDDADAAARPRALLLLDLDHFKEVNDTFGHERGDALLREVADRLRGAVRADDTVARLGGDEFAVLLPGADAAGAARVATDLRAALDAPLQVAGQALRVGASVGIALGPVHGADGPTLLRHADVAMDAAKRARSGHAIYDPTQDQHSPARLALVGDLRDAIEGGALTLHYQPQVDLASGRVCGVEALVRWPHPERGLIPPDAFIPLAEQTGLIAPLTNWVLGEAIRQGRAWQRAGLLLGVSVNLSMWNLHDPALPDRVASLLQEHGLSPAWLRLELTESALMADTDRTMDVLARLSALGVRLGVDDFGSGYSSLAYLKRLPVDELKIDKGFVRALATDATDAAIVASTVALGHALGLRVVAEGIEDRATWDLLVAQGCDVAQGYYLSRPLPAEALARWLRDSPWAVA
jgi:diguanylate cyclase (GGDEF)-like protein/PAS domain S-box-containing protein